jgi:hypothetical protein
MRIISDKVVEKIKTYVLYSVTFFVKIVPFLRKYGKILYSWPGQAKDDNMVHEHCTLHN